MRPLPRPLSDAALYGSLAFGLGFLFGALRETVLVPRIGPRAGRLAEFPAVTGSVVLLGLRLARRWPAAPWRRLARGVGGAGVLLGLESALALLVLGKNPREYLQQFDVARGNLFPVGLAAMVLAPLLGRRDRQRPLSGAQAARHQN